MAARGQDLRDTVSRLMKTWLAFLQRPESDGHLGHLQDLRGGGAIMEGPSCWAWVAMTSVAGAEEARKGSLEGMGECLFMPFLGLKKEEL